MNNNQARISQLRNKLSNQVAQTIEKAVDQLITETLSQIEQQVGEALNQVSSEFNNADCSLNQPIDLSVIGNKSEKASPIPLGLVKAELNKERA